jgi:lipoprotein NlpI
MRTSIRLVALAIVIVPLAAALAGGQEPIGPPPGGTPTTAAEFKSRGDYYASKKDMDKAIKDYDEALRLDPKFGLAYVSRGMALAGKKDFDKAIKDYDQAIKLNPKDAYTFVFRGIAWSGKEDLDKALKDYDEAIKLDPKLSIALLNRGNLWAYKKDYDKAFKDLDEAIRLGPNDPLAFYHRGNVWRDKEDYDKAIKDYDEAIRLYPKFTNAIFGRADARSFKKDYNQAIKDYDEVIRLEPENAGAYFQRSVMQMITHQKEAPSGFQKVLELDGWKTYHSPYVVMLGHLSARQNGDETTAKQFLTNSAGKLAEEWPLPVLQFLRGEIDEPALLKLATDDEKRAEVHCYLGLDHALKGRKDKAIAHFRWVKEHPVPQMIETAIALAELERLERAEK